MDGAERIALGLVDAERKRRARMPGAEILEVDGLVLALSNVPDPELNAVVVASEPRDPVGALRAAEEIMRSRGHVLGLHFQVNRHPSVDAAVRELGLTRILERPGFVVALSDLPHITALEGVGIRPVDDESSAGGLVEVGVGAFGDDPDVAGRFYASSAYGVPGASSFVAWEDGHPVGSASAYFHEAAVGVFGVGVVPSARRRGVGTAITVRASRAFPETDLAWLHPSRMARSMYERIGFKPVSVWEVWVRASA